MFRVAAFGFLLGAFAPLAALAAAEGTPEILGVTYPRSAPPDLIAPLPEGWVIPNATGIGARAAAAPPLAAPPSRRITADLGLQQQTIAFVAPVRPMSCAPAAPASRGPACSRKYDLTLPVSRAGNAFPHLEQIARAAPSRPAPPLPVAARKVRRHTASASAGLWAAVLF